MVQNSPPRSGEDNQSVNKWEKENQETTRELLKVKDRLIEVERNVRCVFNITPILMMCCKLFPVIRMRVLRILLRKYAVYHLVYIPSRI